jgi:hypothetical protein
VACGRLRWLTVEDSGFMMHSSGPMLMCGGFGGGLCTCPWASGMLESEGLLRSRYSTGADLFEATAMWSELRPCLVLASICRMRV